MASFDKQFCIMIETEYLKIKKIIDFVIVKPEQFAEKIRSYCFRIVNVFFKIIIDEIAYLRDYILELIQVVTDSKINKNVRKICKDMFRCKKLFTLCANKGWFGNISEEDLANIDKFEQYVCGGKLIEAARVLVNAGVALVNAFIDSVKTAITSWVTIQFNLFITQYRALLASSGVTQLMGELDDIAECVFGACNIGATVKNFINNTNDSLALNANGQVDVGSFKSIFDKGLEKVEGLVVKLEETVEDAKEYLPSKTSKNDISHSENLG